LLVRGIQLGEFAAINDMHSRRPGRRRTGQVVRCEASGVTCGIRTEALVRDNYLRSGRGGFFGRLLRITSSYLRVSGRLEITLAGRRYDAMNASVSVVVQIAWVWNLLLQWAENWVTSYLVTLNSPPRHSVRINITGARLSVHVHLRCSAGSRLHTKSSTFNRSDRKMQWITVVNLVLLISRCRRFP
jgi:hypothetical protein